MQACLCLSRTGLGEVRSGHTHSVSPPFTFQLSKTMSSGSGEKGKEGAAWTARVYFDPHADETDSEICFYTDDELQTALAEHVGQDEVITNVQYYTHPLSAAQVTAFVFYHAFIVFETEHWWWSIEKNMEGITIQRARNIENVRDKYRQKERTAHWWASTSTPSLLKSTPGQQDNRMWHICDFLYAEYFLNEKYNWTSANCQHFADAFYGKPHEDIRHSLIINIDNT